MVFAWKGYTFTQIEENCTRIGLILFNFRWWPESISKTTYAISIFNLYDCYCLTLVVTFLMEIFEFPTIFWPLVIKSQWGFLVIELFLKKFITIFAYWAIRFILQILYRNLNGQIILNYFPAILIRVRDLGDYLFNVRLNLRFKENFLSIWAHFRVFV